MTTIRPQFKAEDFDKEAPSHSTLADDKKPRVLNKLTINEILINLAKNIRDDYVRDVKTRDDWSFEIPLIARCYDFLQNEADLNDPDAIRNFGLFFRKMVAKYSVRYYDEGNKYVNGNVGELDYETIKLILILTAFCTRSCIMSTNSNNDPINHMDDGNDTMDYQTYKILGNAFNCMNNEELTDDSILDLVKNHIARADVHVRGGTVGNGNVFSDFVEEVNGDADMKRICEIYQWELDGKIKIDDRNVSSCEPILLDILLGIMNFAIDAAYIKAKGGKLNIFLASGRSKFIFEPNDKGEYKFGVRESELANIGTGLHPNAVQANLTNAGKNTRPPEQIIELDRGITTVLEPLRGVPIRVKDGGAERGTTFKSDESDFFRRLYIARLHGIVQDEEDDISYKNLVDALEILKKLEAKLKKVNEERDEAEKAVKTEEREGRKLEGSLKRADERTKRQKQQKDRQTQRGNEAEKKSQRSQNATNILDSALR